MGHPQMDKSKGSGTGGQAARPVSCPSWRARAVVPLFSLTIFLGVCFNQSHAQEQGTGFSPFGVWWNAEHDAKIEMFRASDGALTGRIIALLPVDADSRDEHNPNSALRARPVLGTVIITGFCQKPGEKEWTGGSVYDPQEGKTYQGSIWLDDAVHLNLHGYMGITLFGRTEVFDKVEGAMPERQQDNEPHMVYVDGQKKAHVK